MKLLPGQVAIVKDSLGEIHYLDPDIEYRLYIPASVEEAQLKMFIVREVATGSDRLYFNPTHITITNAAPPPDKDSVELPEVDS